MTGTAIKKKSRSGSGKGPSGKEHSRNPFKNLAHKFESDHTERKEKDDPSAALMPPTAEGRGKAGEPTVAPVDKRQAEIEKTRAIDADIDEAVGAMHKNIDKASQRGENLESLNLKTEALKNQSSAFHKKSVQVRKKMWWKNKKYAFIIGSILLAIILVIAVIFLVK